MSAPAPSTRPTFTGSRVVLLGLIAIAATATAVVLSARFGHAPDWPLFLRQPTVLHIHVAAALTALVIGTVQMVGVKGTAVHRTIGWSWIAAMVVTAVSSFFIRVIHPGSFSLIHLLSGWTLIALPMGVWAIRRGKVFSHARFMVLTYVGGLIVAGALTFLPGRLLWDVFFG